MVFAAALVINLPGAAYLIALKDIAAAHHPPSVDIALVVAFNLMSLLFAEIALLGVLLAPDRTIQLVQRVNGWLSANGRRIAVTLCAALSIYLITRGIAHSGTARGPAVAVTTLIRSERRLVVRSRSRRTTGRHARYGG